MSVLWDLENATIADIRPHLIDRWEPDMDYRALQTLLRRLERKQCVSVDRRQRKHYYRPRLGRDFARRLAVDDLLLTYFGNSTRELIAYLQARIRTLPFA